MMHYGVDYYPEHWPRERWATDAGMMTEHHMNVVRMAEFAWCRMEPEPGRYDFSWLDDAIEVLGAKGIRVILCTPTATPPLWLTEKHPDICMRDQDGSVWGPGSRRHACPTSPVYREHSRRITRMMAEHFKENPHVIGWQTDNEFGCHQARCYCEACRKGFQDWLRRKYGTVEALNKAWGNIVWSQEVTDFSQVLTPLKTPALPNPAHVLDYWRYQSDAYVDFQREQVQILREVMPQAFVTHNAMGVFRNIDYYKLFADLDFVSWDNYPGHTIGHNMGGANATPRTRSVGLAHDIMRGIKRKNFWVMEEQGGATTNVTIGRSPRPGELAFWAMQGVAHGADGMVYFRWRTAQVGAEQYWHGVLDHDGRPNRRLAEVSALGAALQKVGETIVGSRVTTPVALLHSYDISWAFDIQPHNPDFSYIGQFLDWHEGFQVNGQAVDVISVEEDDLSGYKVLVVPSLYLCREEIVRRLEKFAADGGTVVVTARSGAKDWHSNHGDDPLPGPLAPLARVRVEEYDSLYAGNPNTLHYAGQTYPVRGWADVLAPLDGAEVLGTYGQGWYAGRAAITQAACGKGRFYYIGTLPDARFYADFAARLMKEGGVAPIAQAAPGLELTQREQGGRVLRFALNHGLETAELQLDGPVTDLLTGERFDRRVPVSPLGFRVLV